MEREGDCDFDPDAMKSSRETQSLKQGLQRGSNIQESYYDNSYDTLEKTPWKRSFHLHSQSMDYQNFRGGSGVSLRLKMTKRPASPSPHDNNQHGNDTPSSASLSFSFFSPRTSFAQSELQLCSLGEEVAGTTKTTISEEKEGMPSTFYDARKSTSALLVNPRRPPAPMSSNEEICPQPRIQQGYSVRRANLPRRYSRSESHIVLLEETHDKALELPKIEAVQPDPGKDQDSSASNASKNAAKNPKYSSEGFESSTPVENFHLPATKEEENLEKNDTSIEVLSGKTPI
ncbi:hypothetical protein SUGI_0333730 [Cryptomeria japonica]|nr:hypothetical protein SUGI_0333730 [Cryptomeria japonica]